MKFTLTIENASASEMAALFNALANADAGLSTLKVATVPPAISGEAVVGKPVIVEPIAAVPPMPPTPTQHAMATPAWGAVMPSPTQHEPIETETVNHNAPNVDSTGLPWDGRIHSDAKSLTANGTWRKRRGVMNETIAAVEAELRGHVAAPVAAVTPMPMPPQVNSMPTVSAPAMVPMPPQLPQTPVQQMPTVSAPAMVPMPPQLPQIPSNPSEVTFPVLMQNLTLMMRPDSGYPPLTAEYIMSVVVDLSKHFGVHLNSLTDISSRPDMIAHAVSLLKSTGRWPQ